MFRLQAPAKLNLYLRVLGRRTDGYHELETLFERIDLADELTFAPQAGGIAVTCDDPGLPCGPENLVTKAAALLQRATGSSQGMAVHLVKRIPIASGLGGGSSDAAATLVGLNQLWNLRFARHQLAELASQLGSDVPFFLEETAFAIGRGRGERCEPLNGTMPTLWHVLVVPRARLSTQEIYEQFDERRRTDLTAGSPSITMASHALRNGSLDELAKGLHNDLEPEAIRRCPVIPQIQGRLSGGGCPGVLTSGSGPAVFGLCESASHATTIAQRLRESGPADWSVHVVKTC
jgi:4-diphosphocytidyl-2-C-methyl-D-erythritol kinase